MAVGADVSAFGGADAVSGADPQLRTTNATAVNAGKAIP
jgi:hypothetical protein